jgi:hypothetical protein
MSEKTWKQSQKRVRPVKLCSDCLHSNESIYKMPCNDCYGFEHWEPKFDEPM